MLSKVNFKLDNQYYDKIKILYNIKEFRKSYAKGVLWDHYINPDKPTTFAKKPQDIENIKQFQDETYQLFGYLMTKYNGFKDIKKLKGNEMFEFINFMSPGRDKPAELVYWDKCIIASICCGLAPTEDQYNDKSYNQINKTLIKKNIIPLLFLILEEIKKYGSFNIIKTSKEDKNLKLKNGKTYYLHYLSIIRSNVGTFEEAHGEPLGEALQESHGEPLGEPTFEYANLELNEDNYNYLIQRMEFIKTEINNTDNEILNLLNEYCELNKIINDMSSIN